MQQSDWLNYCLNLTERDLSPIKVNEPIKINRAVICNMWRSLPRADHK